MVAEILNKLSQTEQEVVNNNTTLIELLNSLKPEDQMFYAPKVLAIIKRTAEIVGGKIK